MEVSRKRIELVHVMPFTFRPDERLQGALQEFIQPGPMKPRFLFKTMSSLAIDATHQDDPEVRRALFNARQDVDRRPFELPLMSTLIGQRLASGALRLYFGIENDRELRARQRALEKGLYDPAYVTDGSSQDVQLIVTVPASVLTPSSEAVGRAGARLKALLGNAESASGHKVVSAGIAGSDQERLVERVMYNSDSYQ